MKNPAKKFAESKFVKKHQPRPSVRLLSMGLVMVLGCFFLYMENPFASMIGFMFIMVAVVNLARFVVETARILRRKQ